MKVKGIIAICFLLFILESNAQSKPEKSIERPNILFIEVDDLNYEYLSSFGSTIVKTPNIDRLADQGIRFENAVAQGMMCGPSRNSLITGLYPHNLGFYNNGEMKALPKGIWTFPKGLQNSGYYTAWVGKCHIRPGGKNKTDGMKNNMGFDFVKQTQGRVVLTRNVKKDENYADKDWYLRFLKEKGLVNKFVEEYPEISTLPEEAYLDAFFTSEAQEFLNSYKEEEPFFLWLNYSVPHGPNDIHQRYHDDFDVKNMPGSTETNFDPPKLLVKKTKLSEDEGFHKNEQAGHSAMVAFMDDQVGRIMDTLEKNGQLENTVVVFFSDQGIMLGDHKRQHKGTLFRQITNPALIFSYPKAYKTNKTVNTPVELIDLVNTVLDIADAPKKEFEYSKTSNSMVPLLTGEQNRIREIAFAEIDGYVMATDGRYRLIKGEDANLLFDDLKDPKNLKNIAEEAPEIANLLSSEIDAWFKLTGKALPKKTY